MADNKDLRNNQDRDRVAGEENYELSYIQEKLGVSREEVESAIENVGSNREKIEEFIQRNKG